jgi:glycosyltransferase involved in cell wall biosynthesis
MVVAQSEWAARSLRDDYDFGTGDRLRVIPFGVVVPETLATHEASDSPEITWVGATMERKGGRRLLELFRRELRGRCRLNLVTREQVPEEPGVTVFRDIEPNDGKLAAVLARSAVFVLPSTMDTFGYAMLEAMAAGVPVVAFRCHAAPEIVDDGVTGLLVDPASGDDALAAVLGRLLDDADLRSRMGAAGRARVLERFDARVTTAQLLEVLAEARRRHG